MKPLKQRSRSRQTACDFSLFALRLSAIHHFSFLFVIYITLAPLKRKTAAPFLWISGGFSAFHCLFHKDREKGRQRKAQNTPSAGNKAEGVFIAAFFGCRDFFRHFSDVPAAGESGETAGKSGESALLCQNQHRDGRKPRAADHGEIVFHQQLALFDLLIRFHKAFEALTVETDGIDAHMDDELMSPV